MSSVFFLSESFFKTKSNASLEKWLLAVSKKESCVLGSVVFVPKKRQDVFILNKKHLKGDYFTDVLTFNYNKEKILFGDVVFSVCDVLENAKKHGCVVEKEFLRVFVHGLLHLVGYNDQNKKESLIMKEKEDFYVALYFRMFHVKPIFVYV